MLNSKSTVSVVCLGFSTLAQADFIKSSEATLTLRNAYENVDYRSGANAPSKTEEWGQAFILDYKSGFTDGDLGFGIDALGLWGLRLDSGGKVGKANRTRNPGTMFPLEHDGSAVDQFGSLGVTGKLRFAGAQLKTGTLMPQLPVLRSNNGRLLPQTFEGTQINYSGLERLSLTAGRLSSVKSRVSSNNEGMRIPGGTALRNEFDFAGLDYTGIPNVQASYYYGRLKDYYKQHYLGLTYIQNLPVGRLDFDFRGFVSDSDGKNKFDPAYSSSGYYQGTSSLTRGEVDNQLWSAYVGYKVVGHELGFGYQQLNGNSDFPHINQGDGSNVYLITDAMLGRFIRAGEKTNFAKYSYDFAAAGIPGLSASLLYWQGRNVRTAVGHSGEWERQYIINYVVQSGPLKSASVSWKASIFRTEVKPASTHRDGDDYRLTVNYPISLF